MNKKSGKGQDIVFKPIGVVHSPFKEPEDIPRGMNRIPGAFAKVRGELEIFPQCVEGLRDVTAFSHLIVTFAFHKSTEAKLLVKPPGETRPRGVFSTRSPHRPNALGLTIVKLASRRGNTLRVTGIDMVEGTPILDIKPYTTRDRKSAITTRKTVKRVGGRPAKDRSAGGLFNKLDSPFKIQRYLDRLEYDCLPGTRSPLWIAREKKANCFEGAIFAAAALRAIGHKPLLVDLVASNDDDHILAVFKRRGHWGAVAKSNFSVLRFREPVYRTIRELVMSYFDIFFNTRDQKSLRSYSRPFNLARFDRRNWVYTDEDLGYIGDALNAARHIRMITPVMARDLVPADKILHRSIYLGAKKAGIYKAK